MIIETTYKIIDILYIILVPNLWIKYLTIPLILILSFFILTKYKKQHSFFERIVIVFVFYIIFFVIIECCRDYLGDIIRNDKLIKILQEQKANAKVYINDIEIVSSKKVIENLEKIRYYHRPKFMNEHNESIYISINKGQKAIRFKLYKDIHFKYKYWIYRLNKENSSTYIGWTCLVSPNIKQKIPRIVTNTCLNFKDKKSFFEEPIKVIKDGKIIEKQF